MSLKAQCSAPGLNYRNACSAYMIYYFAMLEWRQNQFYNLDMSFASCNCCVQAYFLSAQNKILKYVFKHCAHLCQNHVFYICHAILHKKWSVLKFSKECYNNTSKHFLSKFCDGQGISKVQKHWRSVLEHYKE